jgi:hypothetical protein
MEGGWTVSRSLLLPLAVLACVAVAGCATITGTVTGAGTGLVDLPAETYRHNCEAFEKYPILYGLNAVVIGPIGCVTGPLMGFVKGASLDVQWLVDHVSYADAFGSYAAPSVWRPHTIRWQTIAPKCAAGKDTES